METTLLLSGVLLLLSEHIPRQRTRSYITHGVPGRSCHFHSFVQELCILCSRLRLTKWVRCRQRAQLMTDEAAQQARMGDLQQRAASADSSPGQARTWHPVMYPWIGIPRKSARTIPHSHRLALLHGLVHKHFLCGDTPLRTGPRLMCRAQGTSWARPEARL